MAKLFLVVIFCLSSLSLLAQDEETAVKKAVEDAYVKGIFIEGSAEAIEKGWYDGCEIVIFNNNEIKKNPVSNFIKRFEQRPGGLDKTVTHKFKYVSVTGYAAIAIVEIFSKGKHKYTDYLNLYKFDDGWKISTKTYYDAEYEALQKKTAVKTDFSIFKKYVGKYQGINVPQITLEILEENGKCYVDFQKQGKFEIFAERQDFYFMRAENLQFEFLSGNNEDEVIFYTPDGKKFELKKI